VAEAFQRLGDVSRRGCQIEVTLSDIDDPVDLLRIDRGDQPFSAEASVLSSLAGKRLHRLRKRRTL
jgi:hypothetical protein